MANKDDDVNFMVGVIENSEDRNRDCFYRGVISRDPRRRRLCIRGAWSKYHGERVLPFTFKHFPRYKYKINII